MQWPERIFDCHSHWGTPKAHVFNTPAELENQKNVFKTPGRHYTEQEMADCFRKNKARVMLHLYITNKMSADRVQEYNDYTFDFARRHRDVVFGHWLNFDPRRKDEGLAEWRRALEADAGYMAMAMAGHGLGIPASDPLWDPFYEASMEAGRPVMLFSGLTGIGQGMRGGKGIILDNMHPRHIDAVAARFPELNIIAARPAWPWQDEMLAVLLHKANVTYEIHGWSPKYLTPALKREIRTRLQDRVMFGCDFPAMTYERVVNDWIAEGYSDAILEKLFFRNAEKYFGIA
ncbi:MAG TPA: amidohydrolase family protein [Burkholderiales bacterium]|nr:amidohydrolase family protein [Burkholderiales bacterium]